MDQQPNLKYEVIYGLTGTTWGKFLFRKDAVDLCDKLNKNPKYRDFWVRCDTTNK